VEREQLVNRVAGERKRTSRDRDLVGIGLEPLARNLLGSPSGRRARVRYWAWAGREATSRALQTGFSPLDRAASEIRAQHPEMARSLESMALMVLFLRGAREEMGQRVERLRALPGKTPGEAVLLAGSARSAARDASSVQGDRGWYLLAATAVTMHVLVPGPRGPGRVRRDRSGRGDTRGPARHAAADRSWRDALLPRRPGGSAGRPCSGARQDRPIGKPNIVGMDARLLLVSILHKLGRREEARSAVDACVESPARGARPVRWDRRCAPMDW
jgi:hypothetical protein